MLPQQNSLGRRQHPVHVGDTLLLASWPERVHVHTPGLSIIGLVDSRSFRFRWIGAAAPIHQNRSPCRCLPSSMTNWPCSKRPFYLASSYHNLSSRRDSGRSTSRVCPSQRVVESAGLPRGRVGSLVSAAQPRLVIRCRHRPLKPLIFLTMSLSKVQASLQYTSLETTRLLYSETFSRIGISWSCQMWCSEPKIS